MSANVSLFTQKVKRSDGTFKYVNYYFATIDYAVQINDNIENGPQDGTDLHTALTDICKDINDNHTLATNAYNLAKGVSSSFVFADAGSLMTGFSSNVGDLGSYKLAGDDTQPGFKIGDNLFVRAKKIPDYWIAQISKTKISGMTGTADNLTNATDGSSFVVKWGDYYVMIVATETKTDLSGYASNNDLVRDYIAKSANWTINGDDVSGSGTYGNGLTLNLKDVGTPGMYSAVKTDSKGRVIEGAQMVVFATSESDPALNSLAEGGIAIITRNS